MKTCQICGNHVMDNSLNHCPHCRGTLNTTQVPAPTPPSPQSVSPMEYSSDSVAHKFKELSTKRYMLSTTLAVVGLVILISTFFVPWYYYETELNNTDKNIVVTTELDEGLRSGKIKQTTEESGVETTETDEWEWADEDDEVAQLYKYLFYILIVAMVVGGVGLCLSLFSVISSPRRPRYRKLGVGFNSVAALLVAAIVILHQVCNIKCVNGYRQVQIQPMEEKTYDHRQKTT